MTLGVSTKALYALVDEGYLDRSPEGLYDPRDVISLMTPRSDIPSSGEVEFAIDQFKAGHGVKFCALAIAIHPNYMYKILQKTGLIDDERIDLHATEPALSTP